MYENVKGLFNTLSEKFKSSKNETILSLHYCKLMRNTDDSAEEWMGRLRIKVTDKRLKEQVINDINDPTMRVNLVEMIVNAGTVETYMYQDKAWCMGKHVAVVEKKTFQKCM